MVDGWSAFPLPSRTAFLTSFTACSFPNNLKQLENYNHHIRIVLLSSLPFFFQEKLNGNFQILPTLATRHFQKAVLQKTHRPIW